MFIFNEQLLTILPGKTEWLLLLLTICRAAGLFLFSPFFTAMYITTTVRFFLACFTGFLLALVLYPQYLEDPLRTIQQSTIQIIWLSVTEIFIGYLIGFCFSIMFDAMRLAGELIDTLTGMSAGQIFDPITNLFYTLTGQLIVLFGMVILLSIDAHHVLVKIIAKSFQIIPVGHFQLHGVLLNDIVDATAQLFSYALKIGAIPLVLIIICLAGISLTIRVIPEMNLLMIGIPMRALIGLFTLILAIGHMPTVFKQAFWYYANLVMHMLAG